MKKPIVFGISILLILTIPIGILLIRRKPALLRRIQTKPNTIVIEGSGALTPTPDDRKIFLGFLQSSLTGTVGKEVNVDIQLDNSAAQEIRNADLYVTYDPAILRLDTVIPGTFFSEPMEFKKRIDNNTGTLLYAIGSTKTMKGKQVIATLTFTPLVNTPSTSIHITSQTLLVGKSGQVKTLILSDPAAITVAQ